MFVLAENMYVYVYVETDKVLRDNVCYNRQYVVTDIVISYNICVFTCNIFTHVVIRYVYLHVCVYRQHKCLRMACVQTKVGASSCLAECDKSP